MKTPSSSDSVKSMKNQKSPTKPNSNSHANSKERPPLSKSNNDENVVPNTDDIITTDVNTNPEMNQPTGSIEVDNTTHSRTSETDDSTTNSTTGETTDSIDPPPMTYPFIKESDDSIKIFIYNTDAGKEGDLTHFYDNSYWELVGLHPDVEVSKDTVKHRNDIATTTQKGGDNENTNKDEPDGPYQYFARFLSSIFKGKEQTTKSPLSFNKPIEDSKQTEPTYKMKESPEAMTGFSGMKNTGTSSPVAKEDGLLYIHPTVPHQNVSLTKQLEEEGAHLQKTVFNTTATKVINTTDETNDTTDDHDTNIKDDRNITNNNVVNTISNIFDTNESNPSVVNQPNIIVLTFFPNKGIKRYSDVIETRNQDTDIDITQSRFKFKELEKIKVIKDTKKLTEDVSIGEVFYINGKIVVLKGMLNTSTNRSENVEELKRYDLINVDAEISAFPNTRGYIQE
jgi:hypothetical protein